MEDFNQARDTALDLAEWPDVGEHSRLAVRGEAVRRGGHVQA